MQVISMSAVALGPDIHVANPGGCAHRSNYPATVSTTWLVLSMHSGIWADSESIRPSL
jgi:hypothetical protein